WLIIRDPAQKAKLAALHRTATEAAVARAPGRSLPPHQSSGAWQRIMDSVVWQSEHLHEAPAIIIACLEFDAPIRDSFSFGANHAGSIWPGVQNLLLAARALGLG